MATPEQEAAWEADKAECLARFKAAVAAATGKPRRFDLCRDLIERVRQRGGDAAAEQQARQLRRLAGLPEETEGKEKK